MRAKLSLSGSVKECQHQLIVSILSTKALTNYHVRNSGANYSLLSPANAIKAVCIFDQWFGKLIKKPSLVTIHSKPLINDSNCFYGIGTIGRIK